MEWYLKVLRQYADFNGRARRKEYWMFTLFNIIVSFITLFLDGMLNLSFTDDPFSGGILNILYSLAVFLPGLAVMVRRLHDVGKSGWMCLIAILPVFGIIWLIVILCRDSEYGENQYGPNPKGLGNDDGIDTLMQGGF